MKLAFKLTLLRLPRPVTELSFAFQAISVWFRHLFLFQILNP